MQSSFSLLNSNLNPQYYSQIWGIPLDVATPCFLCRFTGVYIGPGGGISIVLSPPALYNPMPVILSLFLSLST